MKPIVHGLEAKYSDRINFVYLDIDDPNTAGLKTDLNYIGQPQYILVDGDGKIIQQWLGFVPQEEFVSTFKRFLQ
jgi:thioredoxin-related protein